MNKAAKWTPAFVTVAAGAVLALGGCDHETRTYNPPPPKQISAPTAQPSSQPSATAIPPTNPPAPPGWDDVGSGHPEGATNPPSPVLQLLTNGSCYKEWHAGMLRMADDTKEMKLGGKSYNVRILTAVDDGMGSVTQIQCPPDAAKVLAENKDKAVRPAPKKP